jgi:hypothetical protein
VSNGKYDLVFSGFYIHDTRALVHDTLWLLTANCTSTADVTHFGQFMGNLSSSGDYFHARNIAVQRGISVPSDGNLKLYHALFNFGHAHDTEEQVIQTSSKVVVDAVLTYFGAATAIGLVNQALDAILCNLFADCDGVVAYKEFLYTADQLAANTAQTGSFSPQDDNYGMPSPGVCGAQSHYDVRWTITRVAE